MNETQLFYVFTMRLIAVCLIEHSNDNASIKIAQQNMGFYFQFLPQMSGSCFKNLACYYQVGICRDISKNQYRQT